MRLVAVTLLASTLAGCLGLGVQNMSPEQIKATAGMATCTTLNTTTARGNSVAVNLDDVRKGATNKSRIIMTPDCGVTIETDVGVAPVPAKP